MLSAASFFWHLCMPSSNFLVDFHADLGLIDSGLSSTDCPD